MAHRITWIDEPWIVQVTFEGLLTSEDIEAVIEVCLPQAESHPINFLFDLTQAYAIEPGVMRSKSMRQLMTHPNSKWFAITGVEGLRGFGDQVFMRFTSFKIFPALDEARIFLRETVERQKSSVRILEGQHSV